MIKLGGQGDPLGDLQETENWLYEHMDNLVSVLEDNTHKLLWDWHTDGSPNFG